MQDEVNEFLFYVQSQLSGSQDSRGSRDSLLDHSMDSEEGLDDLPSPDNVKGGKKKIKQEKAKKGRIQNLKMSITVKPVFCSHSLGQPPVIYGQFSKELLIFCTACF